MSLAPHFLAFVFFAFTTGLCRVASVLIGLVDLSGLGLGYWRAMLTDQPPALRVSRFAFRA